MTRPPAVQLLGTGSPMTRIDRAGPSQVVVADGRCYVVDCGERTSVRLQEAEIRPQQTTRLLFTHLHSDHTLGYAHFAIGGWLQGVRISWCSAPREPSDTINCSLGRCTRRTLRIG